MRKSIVGIFTLIFLLVMTGCTQNQVKEQEGARIVVICPEVVQILDRLEIEGIVGIVETDNLPARYQDVTQVGTAETLDVTAIENMNPTLVLGSTGCEERQVPLFVEQGIDSAFINLSNVTEMIQSIRELGPLIDQEEQTNALVDEFQDFIRTYRTEVAEKEIATVLILVGDADGYKVANETSDIGNLLKLAGGLNVFGNEYGEAYIEVGEEEVQEANPDIILRLPSSLAEGISEMFAKEFTSNEMWSNLDAVTNERVYDLEYQEFGVFEYQEVIAQLRDILHP